MVSAWMIGHIIMNYHIQPMAGIPGFVLTTVLYYKMGRIEATTVMA